MRNDFFQQCFKSQQLIFITPSKAYPFLQEGILLVDLRPDYEGAGKIPDVPNLLQIPYDEIFENLDSIPANEIVILADAVGLRSKEVLIKLKESGYNLAVSMAGGLVDREKEGFPLIVDLSERLTGSCMCQLRPREKGKFKMVRHKLMIEK